MGKKLKLRRCRQCGQIKELVVPPDRATTCRDCHADNLSGQAKQILIYYSEEQKRLQVEGKQDE